MRRKCKRKLKRRSHIERKKTKDTRKQLKTISKMADKPRLACLHLSLQCWNVKQAQTLAQARCIPRACTCAGVCVVLVKPCFFLLLRLRLRLRLHRMCEPAHNDNVLSWVFFVNASMNKLKPWKTIEMTLKENGHQTKQRGWFSHQQHTAGLTLSSLVRVIFKCERYTVFLPWGNTAVRHHPREP